MVQDLLDGGEGPQTKALSLTIAPSVLARADQVIE
jgi:hypothetical protein